MTLPKFKFQGLFNPIKTYLKLFVENKEYDVSLNDFADSISPLINERLPQFTYKVYSVLLSQTGTDDPTAVILEDNITGIVGNIEFVRGGSAGIYRATIDATNINASKVACIIQNNDDTINSIDFDMSNEFTIVTSQQLPTIAPIDNLLNNTFVEIRFYN